MQVGRVAVCALTLALAMACVGLRFRRSDSPGAPLLEFQDAQFDGVELSGRILVGAKDGPVTVDARLTPHAIVSVESVTDCVTKQPVPFLMADSFIPSPHDTDLLTLPQGHWYGADVNFLLFDEKITGKPSPNCILATVVYWPVTPDPDKDKAEPVKVTVHAMRLGRGEPIVPNPDGGADAGNPDADAGAVESARTADIDGGGGAYDGEREVLDGGSQRSRRSVKRAGGQRQRP